MTIMNSTAWMAFFTLLVGCFAFLLWQATKNYTEVTKKLLEQSKEALEQSRRALETDVFSKIVFSALQLDAQLMISEFWKSKRPIYVQDFATGMLVTLENIDPSIFKKISQAVEIWHNVDPRDPAGIFYRALNEIKGKKEGET